MTRVSTRRAMIQFGLRVVEEREGAELTQEQLAERLGIGWRQVQRLEAGRTNPGLELIIELARILGVRPGVLFDPPSSSTKRRPGRPSRDA
ncbi:MAG TPA: helix-turn-helix transcriptional regulator [Polyangiaceae bacterium]